MDINSLKLFNPFFIWKKRRSILNRVKELPDDLLWKMIQPFVRRGFVKNYDFEKIILYKDIHKGKKAFLLGNGPSVDVKDLDRIAGDKDFVVFGCNRIYLAFDQTKLRPDYLLSSDEMMISDFGQEMIASSRNVLFISKRRPFFNGAYIWFKQKNGRPFVFSKEVSNKVMVGGGTLISAIQIAYHLGIREMYLYGVDHNFNYAKTSGNYGNATGEGNHFIKNYRSNRAWQAPVMDLVEESFIKCDKVLREENGYLVNITRGGHLEVLERKDFDEIIK